MIDGVVRCQAAANRKSRSPGDRSIDRLQLAESSILSTPRGGIEIDGASPVHDLFSCGKFTPTQEPTYDRANYDDDQKSTSFDWILSMSSGPPAESQVHGDLKIEICSTLPEADGDRDTGTERSFNEAQLSDVAH